jgi:RimJ/RimL family protein N-acetyltransferase
MRHLRTRPIQADDWRKLQRFHSRLSASTIYLRFHGLKPALSEAWARRLADVDGRDGAAFVVTTGTRGRIVGFACYVRIDSSTGADIAFVVEDAYQGCGLGGRLMRRLADHALQSGITEFSALVLSRNEPMLRLLQAAGPSHVQPGGGAVDVRVDLTTPEAA